MSAKRRLKKMQRQRRVADQASTPETSSNNTTVTEPDGIEDHREPSQMKEDWDRWVREHGVEGAKIIADCMG
jgi:hypothetical protein